MPQRIRRISSPIPLNWTRAEQSDFNTHINYIKSVDLFPQRQFSSCFRKSKYKKGRRKKTLFDGILFFVAEMSSHNDKMRQNVGSHKHTMYRLYLMAWCPDYLPNEFREKCVSWMLNQFSMTPHTWPMCSENLNKKQKKRNCATNLNDAAAVRRIK